MSNYIGFLCVELYDSLREGMAFLSAPLIEFMTLFQKDILLNRNY